MRHLPNIARLAKSLRVFTLILSSAQDRDDVVKNKCVGNAAPCASRIFPVSALSVGEVSTVSQLFSRPFLLQMGASRKHFIAVQNPAKFVGLANLRQCFRRVLIAFWWASLALWGPGAFGCFNTFPGRIVMDATPKWVIFSHHGFTDAFPVFTGHALMLAGEIVCAPVVKRSANAARNQSSGFLSWHGNNDNGVKSVDNSSISVDYLESIPSQAAAAMDSAEGVTTRRVSANDNPVHESPARKGRYSLSYTVTYRSADKEPRDNKTDEVINIAPNSPISAAQFSITQYAAAVSMSGLEMLQNSGKEQIIDLMDGRMAVAEAQLANRIGGDIYLDGTGNASKNITGLGLAVPDTPTSGTYGGISRSTWSFWQSVSYSGVTNGGAAVSAANIQAYLTALTIQLVRGTDKTDLIVMDNNYFQFYVNSLQAIQRIQSDSGSGAAGAGFATLKFFGGGAACDVVLDGGIGANATANHAWCLNTKYIFFRPHRDRNFVPIGGERQSVNQDAVVKLIGWAGNMTCSGSKFQGVVIA